MGAPFTRRELAQQTAVLTSKIQHKANELALWLAR